MRKSPVAMKPQDIVVLLKILCMEQPDWQQVPLAKSLKISQSEVSQSLSRSAYAGLLDDTGKNVMKQTLLDFLQFGLPVVFPAKPGAQVRGIPTAHSAPPLCHMFEGADTFVWPYAKGKLRGFAITPLYATVPDAALTDVSLHQLLALTDALRVGRARERLAAIKELKQRLR